MAHDYARDGRTEPSKSNIVDNQTVTAFFAETKFWIMDMDFLMMSEPISAQTVAELRANERVVQSYLERGRSHRSMPLEGLEARLLTAYQLWSIDPFDMAINGEIDDLTAEYHLRKSDLPVQLIQDYIDQGLTIIKTTFGEISTKEFQSRLEDLMDRYRS
jgi:hypothetical protein